MALWTLEFVRAEEAGDPYAFRAGVQEYLVRRGDGSFEALRWRWDEALTAELTALREPGRDPALPRRIGDRLRAWIGAAIGLERLAAACERGESIELRISSSAAELYALPWELMTLPGSGAHLGALAAVQVTYRWPATTCAAPAAAPRPEGGRVVLAWSRAFGPVGERAVADALAAAAREGHVPWDMSSDEIADVSLPGLVAALEADVAAGRAPAVLHLLCHGAPSGGGYGLGLSDGRGGGVVVDSGALARALAPLARHVRLIVLTACDSGNPGAPGTRLGSAAQELHRAGFEAVVASRSPLSGVGAVEFTGALYRGLFVETAAIDDAFAAARARLLRLPGALDWASVQLYRHAAPGSDRRPVVFRPYRGLLAFEGRHARFFFGREAEAAEVLRELEALVAGGEPRLVVVAGASGTGKSSLVLAAVRPALARRGWSTAVIRPGTAPRRALAEALAREAGDAPLAVIVDQFEEVFTHADDGERRAFARDLWDMVTRTGRTIAAIATLRVDFLGRCGELTLDDAGRRLDEVAYDEAHRTFVPHMSAARLAEAIVRPAERVGLRLEEGLCARLLRDVGEEPGALPLLQHTLDALWTRREGDTLTHAALDAIGGAFGALERHADATVAGLDPPAQAQARRLLVRLAVYSGDMSSGTRRRAAVASLRPPRASPPALEAFERAARALVDARLIRRDDAGETLEVSHEALIRGWRALHGWYEAERERLAMAAELARLVEDSRHYGRALAGRALTRAQELAQALGEELSPEAQALVAESTRVAARQRRSRTIGLAALLGVLATAAAVSAFFWVQSARQLARARDAIRIAAAERVLDAQPWAAAAMLREVEELGVADGLQAAFTVTQRSLPVRFIPLKELGPVGWSPDGAWLVTGDRDAAVRAWSLRGEPIVHVLLGEPSLGAVEGIEVAGEGEGSTIVARRGGGVELWRLGDGAAVRLAGAALASPSAARYAGGRLAVKTAAGVDVLRPVEGRLEPVASGLPCELLADDRLICQLDAAPELRTFAEPTRGEPVPAARIAEVHADGSLDAILGGGQEVHLAWNGARLIRTGFERRDTPLFDESTAAGEADEIVGRRYLGVDREAVYSAVNTAGRDGPSIADRVCRDGPERRCVDLSEYRMVEGIVDSAVVAANSDSWQILNKPGLSTRQIVRAPVGCRELTPAPRGEWLACWALGKQLWVWSLDSGARATETAVRPGALGFQPERARWVELRGGERRTLVAIDPRGESSAPADELWHSPELCGPLVFDGDVAVYSCAEVSRRIVWLDLAGGVRPTVLDDGPDAGSRVYAVHEGTRRVLSDVGDGVALYDFAGPTPRALARASLQRARAGSREVDCSQVGALAIAPDGRTAAVGCRKQEVVLLELPSLAVIASHTMPSTREDEPVQVLEFAPDGARLFAGGALGAYTVFAGIGTDRVSFLMPSVFDRAGVAGAAWTREDLVTMDYRRVSVGEDVQLTVPDTVGVDLLAVGFGPDGTLLGGTRDGILHTWHGTRRADELKALLRARAVHCIEAIDRVNRLGETYEDAERSAGACAPNWREIVVRTGSAAQ